MELYHTVSLFLIFSGRKTKVIINDYPYCEISYDDKNKTKTIKSASNQGFKLTTNINNELEQTQYIDENNQLHAYLTQKYDENGKIIKKQGLSMNKWMAFF